MKVAVITPYYCKESLARLRRCHESVLQQTYPAEHFIVGDGVGWPEVDAWNCQHLKLARDHDDYGNTPRSIGAISALNQGFDAVAFLNADDWYHPEHVQTALAEQKQHRCDVVFTSRQIVLPDGSLVPVDDPEDANRTHVDSSCYVIFKSAAYLLPVWAMMPQGVGAISDRILFSLIQWMNDVRCGWTGKKTVFFESNYSQHFILAGQTAPPIQRSIDWKKIQQTWSERRVLSATEVQTPR